MASGILCMSFLPRKDLQDACVREKGQFSSKGIIYDFIGNLNKITILQLITESASDSLNEPYNISSALDITIQSENTIK